MMYLEKMKKIVSRKTTPYFAQKRPASPPKSPVSLQKGPELRKKAHIIYLEMIESIRTDVIS